MAIDKEFVLKRFLEDPEIKFYDIKYPNRKDIVESFDNDQFSHAQAHDRLKEILNSLNGTYIVTLRNKTRTDLNKGGNVKPAGEYTLQLGNGAVEGISGISAPISGIGYMEKYIEEKTNSLSQNFHHQMELFKLRQEIADLKSKQNEGLGGPLETMMAQVLAKQYLNIDIPTGPAAHSINGVGSISEAESEERVVKAITRIANINLQAVMMLEDMATVLETYPDKIKGFNQALNAAANGTPLLQAFITIA